MINKLITLWVVGLLIWGLASFAGNALKSWSLKDGGQVIVRAQSIACRTLNPVSGEWTDCRRLAGGEGTISAHSDYGLILAGRVRVANPKWGVGWFQLADVTP